jgi:hypothetical protein
MVIRTIIGRVSEHCLSAEVWFDPSRLAAHFRYSESSDLNQTWVSIPYVLNRNFRACHPVGCSMSVLTKSAKLVTLRVSKSNGVFRHCCAVAIGAGTVIDTRLHGVSIDDEHSLELGSLHQRPSIFADAMQALKDTGCNVLALAMHSRTVERNGFRRVASFYVRRRRRDFHSRRVSDFT